LAVPTSTADENNLADAVWMSGTGKRLKMFKAYDFCDPLHGNGREGASVTEVNHVSETVTLEGNRPQSTDTLFSITSPPARVAKLADGRDLNPFFSDARKRTRVHGAATPFCLLRVEGRRYARTRRDVQRVSISISISIETTSDARPNRVSYQSSNRPSTTKGVRERPRDS